MDVLQIRPSVNSRPGFLIATLAEESPRQRTDFVRLNTLLTKARPHIARYALAAAFVGVSLAARMLLHDFFQYRFYVHFFYPAVLLAAYRCGLGPSLFAVVLSAIAIRYFFIRPTGQFFALGATWEPLRLSFFVIWSSLLAYIVSQLQASKNCISEMALELLQSRDQLLREQELLRRLVDQQESEKQTVCNDFHDGPIQHMVGSKMLLETQLDDLPADHLIHEVVHHLSKGITDARRVIRGVRPSVLDEPGLAGPVDELVKHFSTVGFEVDVECSPDCDAYELPDAIKTGLFRICQEALTNCWKHSGCTKATVRIEKQGDYLLAEIDDDGCGIDACWYAATKGFGLKGMDARARLLGGTLDVAGKDKGTRVRARLPLAAEQIVCPAT